MIGKYMNKKNKSINLGFFLEKQNANSINDLKNYIAQLKRIIQKKRNISFDDIDFSYIDNIQKYYEKKESSIGNLLINILEITPIQIAKIMENKFQILDNGETIEKKNK